MQDRFYAETFGEFTSITDQEPCRVDEDMELRDSGCKRSLSRIRTNVHLSGSRVKYFLNYINPRIGVAAPLMSVCAVDRLDVIRKRSGLVL